jgi:hypothetical protein
MNYIGMKKGGIERKKAGKARKLAAKTNYGTVRFRESSGAF